MTKDKKKNKYESSKRYLYNGIFLIALILVVWYIASWYTIKKQERLMESYLVSTNTIAYEIDNIKEAKHVMQELPSEYFIYISYTNDEKIYKLEKKLKNIIDEYELKDEFYYIDVTRDLKDDDLYQTIKDTFNIEISSLPVIIYMRNGEIEKVINTNKDIFNYTELEQLLDEYEYEKKGL